MDDQIRKLFMAKQDSGPRGKWKKPKDELTRGKENDQSLYIPSRLFINSLSGGHLLETEKGLFGMASGMVRKGDAICALFGCPMAIIMRRAGDNWRIIPSCYIHGMDEDASLQVEELRILYAVVSFDNQGKLRNQVAACSLLVCLKLHRQRTWIISSRLHRTRRAAKSTPPTLTVSFHLLNVFPTLNDQSRLRIPTPNPPPHCRPLTRPIPRRRQ